MAGMLPQGGRSGAFALGRSGGAPRPPEREAAGSERPSSQGRVCGSKRVGNTMAPPSPLRPKDSGREMRMRLILGIIIGCALTVGGAYVADTVAAASAKPVMVNWDVVAKNWDSVTTYARESWKRIAG